MADISVIIVNYNTADLVIVAVESVLERHHGGRNVDIHVVDNASPNGDAVILMDSLRRPGWQGRVQVYSEAENHGFGRGNNIVLQKLAARFDPPIYAFLLNPDAALRNEAIEKLADFMDNNDQVAVSGARLLSSDAVIATSAFQFPGLISEFSAGLSFGPVARLLRRWNVPLGAGLETQQADWVSGAATMLRMSAVEEVDFFDPDFFLYYEEVDLMRRLASADWETWHVAEAEAVHLEGAATSVRSGDTERVRRPAYWYASWRLYFLKAYGRPYALAVACAWSTGLMLNLFIASVRGKRPEAPLHFLTDIWGMVVRPLLGLGKRGAS